MLRDMSKKALIAYAIISIISIALLTLGVLERSGGTSDASADSHSLVAPIGAIAQATTSPIASACARAYQAAALDPQNATLDKLEARLGPPDRKSSQLVDLHRVGTWNVDYIYRERGVAFHASFPNIVNAPMIVQSCSEDDLGYIK